MPNEQLLTDFQAPSINGMAAKRILSNEVLYRITQDIIETDGEGVTQRFSTDTSGAQIRVIRILPFKQKARELGASIDGANFSGQTKEMPQSVQYGLNVLTVIDTPIDIAQATMDMIPIDLLSASIKTFSTLVTDNINAMTIAGKMVKTFNYNAAAVDGGGEAYWTEVNSASTDKEVWKMAMLTASSKLDDGDEENAVSMFPIDDRCFVIRTSLRPKLLQTGAIIIGGSNYAQEMLAAGTISPNTKRENRKGYIGMFDETPVYMASKQLWNLAADYIGKTPADLSGVHGYVSSGMANARGIAMGEQMKIIDAPDGQGVRLQPLVRMGFESFYAKGNSFIVEQGFTNPATVAAPLVLKAPGSRA